MATTLADADRMLAWAGQKGRILTVDHVLRFDPRYCMAQERIAGGEVGRLGLIYSWRSHGQRLFQNYTAASPLLGGDGARRRSAVVVRRPGGHELHDPRALYPGPVFGRHAVGAAGVRRRGHRGPAMLLAQPGRAPNHNDCGLEIRGSKATIQVRDPDRGVSVWSESGSVNPFGVTWVGRMGA